MKKIILCDAGNITETSRLSIKYNLGVNIDQFSIPDFLEQNPNSINETLDGYQNIQIYSIHGPFMDLNFGTQDKLIKDATEKRFEAAYEISHKLKIKNIVLHNGYVPGTSYPENWVKRSKYFGIIF